MKIKGSKIGFIIFSLMAAGCMVLIFMFSVQSGLQSSEVSGSFYDLFIKITGFDFVSHGVFRKVAHFSEYSALGFSFAGAVFCYFDKPDFMRSFLPCVAYAVSDEIHQYFVPERACRALDVLIDSCGSFFGLLVFFGVIFIYNRLKNSW